MPGSTETSWLFKLIGCESADVGTEAYRRQVWHRISAQHSLKAFPTAPRCCCWRLLLPLLKLVFLRLLMMQLFWLLCFTVALREPWSKLCSLTFVPGSLVIANQRNPEKIRRNVEESRLISIHHFLGMVIQLINFMGKLTVIISWFKLWWMTRVPLIVAWPWLSPGNHSSTLNVAGIHVSWKFQAWRTMSLVVLTSTSVRMINTAMFDLFVIQYYRQC